MARALFSQSWHSVAGLKPRLLPGARVHRHVYRGQVWYVVQDESGGRYHRFSPAAHALISRMDGSASVQSLWERACAEAREGDVPTQDEIVDLLIQLHAADLMQADVTPDSAALFARYSKRRSQTWKQWLLNPMSLKLPLLDPDVFLGRWASRLGWLFGAKGAVLWLAVVVPALLLAAQHWSELTDNLSDRVLSAHNLIVMAAVFPFVKALHELGHGFAAKVWGGAVHEMGLMLLVFAPAPYVDASSASAFASKRRRAIVGAAGMLVELFLSALALFVWLLVEPGIVRAVAFNVMLVAGISTLIVNGNPLLRYDGYYVLCDLIEMPNLAQRGQRYLTYLWDRYVFGARDLEAPNETASEKRWLVVYAIASWCYRVFITVSIILFIAGEFFVFGVLIAAWGAFSLLGMPLWKAVKHVTKSPTLRRQRVRAVRTACAIAIVIVAVLAFAPVPLRTQAEGVVWLPDQAMLRAGASGFFQRLLVEPGTVVAAGTPVMLMEDPLLASEVAVARAKVAEVQAKYNAEQFSEPTKAEITRRQLEHETRAFERASEKFAKLIVYAQIPGVLTAARPQDMPGQYFKKGEVLGYVLDRKQLIARVVVRQDDVDLVRTRFRSAQLRVADSLPRVYTAAVMRELPGGVDELPSAALGPNGGGSIPVDPKDSNGVKTLERVFVYDMELPAEASPKAFGERVHVRFNHDGEPLLAQGFRRLRQLFLSRFNV